MSALRIALTTLLCLILNGTTPVFAAADFCQPGYLQKINFNVLQPGPFEGAPVVKSLPKAEEDRTVPELALAVDFQTDARQQYSALKARVTPKGTQRGLEGRFLFFTQNQRTALPWRSGQLEDCAGQIQTGSVYALPWRLLRSADDFLDLRPTFQRLAVNDDQVWLLFEERIHGSDRVTKRTALFNSKPKSRAFFVPFTNLFPSSDMAAVQSRLPSGEHILAPGPKQHLAKTINGGESGRFTGIVRVPKGQIEFSLDHTSYQATDKNSFFGHHAPKMLKLTPRGFALDTAVLKIYKKGVLVKSRAIQGAMDESSLIDLDRLETHGRRPFPNDQSWYQLSFVIESNGSNYGLFGIIQGFQGTGSAGGLTFPY